MLILLILLTIMLHLRVIGTIEASEKAGNVIVEGSRHIIPTHPPGNVAMCIVAIVAMFDIQSV